MRGSINDLFFLGFLIVGLILTSFILFRVTDIVTTTCNTTGIAIGADTNATSYCTGIDAAVHNFAGVVPFVLFILGLASVILAAFVPVSPLFLPIGVILWLVAVVIYVNFQQVVPTILAEPFFAPAIAANPLSAFLLSNVGWFILVFGAALLVVMYSRLPRGGGGPEA